MALSAEQRAKLQQQVDQINLKSDAEKTRNDYNAIAALNNWATVNAPNYGTNGRDTIDAGNYTGVGKILGDGSYRQKDVDAAGYDSTHYYYDIRLDPRSNNGAGNAIQDVLQSANLRASQEAAQGLGNYNDLLNKYYAQIGYTDANGVYDSLQKTGTLGLKTLDGKSIEEAYKLGNYDPNSTINYDREYYTSGQFDRDRAAARDAQWAYLESLPVYQQGQVYDGAVTEFNNNGTVLKTGGNGGMGGMGNGNSWGYNMNSDPVWDSYKKEYTREGNQAMNDTVAQLAARTGGMASSYAGQVGQQAYDQYMQEMTDKIPVLEQNAYNRYMDDQNLQLQREQMNNQLDLQKQQLALQQQAQDFSQQQSAASAAAAQRNDNYSNLLTMMSKFGYIPNDQELATAGISREQANAVLQLGQYAPQQARATGYPGGPGIGRDQTPTLTPTPQQQLYDIPITTTATSNEFNTYLDQAKKIKAQGGSTTDFVAKMLQAGMIDEVQAQYILRQMGLI